MRDYSFGDFLYGLRTDAGFTQYQLGKLVGVSDKAVSKWENGTSMPQVDVLYKISEVFGIGIEDLIGHKYDSAEKNRDGILRIKDRLWDEVLKTLYQRYGKDLPMEIYNRFLSERDELINTDIIVFYDFISKLSTEARKFCEHIRIKGGLASSFVAYLSGTTSIDPLLPHYYCPQCCRVIFDNSVKDGYDLPEKICSCGRVMISDGHSIPFMSCRNEINGKVSLSVSVSPEFLSRALLFTKEYFKDCKLTCKESDPKPVRITVNTGASSRSVLFYTDDELTGYKELELATNTSFERAAFCAESIVREFKSKNTDGITEFKSKFIKDMMDKVSISSFYDLLQILGLSHSLGMWRDNGEKLIEQGASVSELMAYRDDVFEYIRDKMQKKSFTDTGFAYKVTEDVRRGFYAKNGVPEDIKTLLRSIGTEDRFIDSVSKAKYLFPKAHGAEYLRYALILMWYKINFPKKFNEIMM